jgi:hypothetical protein
VFRIDSFWDLQVNLTKISCVQTGGMLSQITSIDDIFTSEIFIKLGAIAIVALVPGMIMKKLKERKQNLKSV